MLAGRPVGLHPGSAQRFALFGGQPVRRPARALDRGLTVKTLAALDPHKVLGVSPGASETEIKRAHRKLVKQHHPDLAKGKEGVEVRFLAIQEAYEILLGRRNGKETGAGPAASSWDFHDWFWKFSMKRRRGGAEAPPPPPPEAVRHQWQQQMAGLRAKAAAKRQRPQGRPAAHAAQATNPTEAAASSVWRSTTKNARKAQQPAAATAAQQQAAAPAPQHREVLGQAAAASAAASQTQQQQQQQHSAPVETAAAERPLEPAAATSSATPVSESHEAHEAPAWRSMVTRAVHAVHDIGHRHRSHAERLQSHISSIGEKLSLRLQLQAFKELVPEAAGLTADADGPLLSPLRWRGLHAWNLAGVPSEQELHVLFGEAVRGGGHATEPATAVAGATASDNASYPRMDPHARKFADKEHVKTRLSTQLTGLKRRAAMKREFEEC